MSRSTWIGMHAALAMTLALSACGKAVPQAGATAKSAAIAEAKAVATLRGAVEKADADLFARRDADGDGRLARAELADLPDEAFATLDADHDGRLTPAEAVAQAAPAEARARMAAQMARASRLEAVTDERAEQALTGLPLTAAETRTTAERLFDGDPRPPEGLGKSGPPVVIVPGYLDGSWYFAAVRSRTHAIGRATHVLPLFPNIGDVTITAQRLRAFVEKVKADTGAATVDIVAHSEGGLISRHYIKFLGGDAHVGRLVTLGTPHHGTVLGFIGPGQGAHQMQPGSAFLNELNAGDESWGAVKYTSIRAGLDEIIIPHSSPIQEGAENHSVSWIEHATLLTSKRAWRHVEAGLAR